MAIALSNTNLINDANLVAYYPFNAGSELADAKNSNTLTSNNAVFADGGPLGRYTDFGADNSVVPDRWLYRASNMSYTGIYYSIVAWFKLDVVESTFIRYLITVSENTRNTKCGLSYDTNGVYVYRESVGNTTQTIKLCNPDTNWHQAVLTMNDSRLEAYVDGNYLGYLSLWGSGSADPSNYFWLGSQGYSSNYGRGSLDDVALFNRYLTATEVRNNFSTHYIGKTPLQSGITSLWDFELGDGTDIVGGNTMNVESGSISYGLLYGRVDKGANFNGSSNLKAAYRSYTRFTLGVWFKTDNDMTGIMPMLIGDTFVNPYLNYYINIAGGNVTVGIYQNAYYQVSTPFTYEKGKWHWVVITYDGSNVIFYANGSEIGRSPYTGDPISGGNGLRLGRRWDVTSTECYTGYMDEPFIANRAFSAAEIKKMYAAMTAKY